MRSYFSLKSVLPKTMVLVWQAFFHNDCPTFSFTPYNTSPFPEEEEEEELSLPEEEEEEEEEDEEEEEEETKFFAFSVKYNCIDKYSATFIW